MTSQDSFSENTKILKVQKGMNNAMFMNWKT